MELQQSQNISQKLSQEQRLSQAQLQSLQILAATTQELRQTISAALQENPVLELISNGNEMLVGDPLQRPAVDDERRRDVEAQAVEYDENLSDAAGIDASGDGPMDYGVPAGRNLEAEDKRTHFFDSLTEEPSVLERLHEQLRDETGGSGMLFTVGEAIIGNLDDKGYLVASDEELAAMTDAPLETVQKAVELVQTFEPIGIGARTPRECLLLQLEYRKEQDTIAWQIVDGYLEDLAKNRIPQIAKALKCEVEDVYEAVELIRDLEPFPGRELSNATAPVIAPEATVKQGPDGEWIIVMNRGNYPELGIQENYVSLAEDKSTPSETRSYLKTMINSGNQLIRAIDSRLSTIERITHCIVELQQDFLEHGPSQLHPMVMADIAVMLGLHETTVSRAISGKYLKTPQGLFEYKYFFTAGYSSSTDGEELSSRAIRQKIRALINAEAPDKPLSDQKISELLAEDGLDVARRTVAKYREEEGIPSTSLRRIHT